MRTFGLVLLLAILVPLHSFGDSPAPAPTASAGVPITLVTPTPAPLPSVVPVAEPAAPPTWAQDLMVDAESLPIVGPIISKILLYLGIFCSILTVLACAVLSVLNILMKSLQLSGLANAAAAVLNFKNGKIMYWLKFFSMFNAKAPAPTKTA